MPTAPNTHGSAQTVIAEPHVAYVDNDAVVLAHLRALAAKGNPGVTVVDGDVREVAATLDAVSAGIDLSRPACLLMGALLHFFPPDAARDLVAGYAAALAPGSYVVLSVGRGDGDTADQGFAAYSSGGAARTYNHSVAGFTGFFGDLALVPPGIADARDWHPDPGEEGPFPPRAGYTIAGVARLGDEQFQRPGVRPAAWRGARWGCARWAPPGPVPFREGIPGPSGALSRLLLAPQQ